MVAKGQVVAIVQARGGSKGIPKKNLQLLGDHPLVAYSITNGLAAKNVSRVIVSTDDPEIAQVSRHYGAEVPFIRPKELAEDDTTDLPVFQHALRWLQDNEGYRPEIVVQLRPTSPIGPRGFVAKAVDLLLEDPAADSVRSVTSPFQNPYKMWRLSDNGYLDPLIESELEEPYNTPRQKLPPTYWQTGHIDVIRRETILGKGSMTGKTVKPLPIVRQYCIDIDTVQDLQWANWVLKHASGLDVDYPDADRIASPRKTLPTKIDLVVFDFDGVFTDNRVWVLEDGREAVACNRSDGMGIAMLKEHGIEALVLSTEANPVVAARCTKLGITCIHGQQDKSRTLRSLVEDKGLDWDNVVYVGNDINDVECMRLSGYSVAVADAHRSAADAADIVLEKPGGYGAVREVCDIILGER